MKLSSSWMMLFMACIAVATSFMYSTHAADQAKPTRTLVLLEKNDMEKTHSKFIQQFRDKGHEVTVISMDTPASGSTTSTGSSNFPLLREFGVALYENLAILAPTFELTSTKGEHSIISILRFIDDGGNLFLATGNAASPWVKDIANECGVDIKSIPVWDYFSHEKSSDATVIATSKIANGLPKSALHALVGGDKKLKVYYKGTVLSITAEQEFRVPILSGEGTAFAAASSDAQLKQTSLISGLNALLVAGIQARNNARAVFCGSVDALSDAFISLPESNNLEFFKEITRWGFGERGILRAVNIKHHLESGGAPETQIKHVNREDLPKSMFPDPEIAPNSLVYRIKDDIVFKFDIQQNIAGANDWHPYNANDVQLEFVMLDPYIRQGVTNVNKNGQYEIHFKIPDVYGVYKFRVMYRRPGYSTLSVEEQVSIRPYRHNEYERFIVAALPYYTSAFTMMIGVFIFSLFFLFTK